MKKFLLKLSGIIYKYKKLVIIFWLAMIVFSITNIILHKNGKLETDLKGLENTEAYQVIQSMKKDFNFRFGISFAMVMDNIEHLGELQNDLKSNFKAITKIAEINSNINHKSHLIHIEIHPDYHFIDVENLTPQLREHIKKWSEKYHTKVYLTGNPAFHYDADKAGKNDSIRSESFALVISFFILILNFGALVSALIPLIIGATTLLYLNNLIYLLDLEINALSQILTGLIGLALAIDYSLFIVSRYREESDNGITEQEVIDKIFIYPVKTIIVSALIMLCSISALLIPDVSTSRNVVYNFFTVILISLFNSIIILPALLIYGKNILDKPKFLSDFVKKTDSYPLWKKYSTAVVRHPKRYFVLCLIILLTLSYPVKNLRLWEAGQTLTPENTESIEGYKFLEHDNWGGELIPVYLVVKANNKQGVYTREFISYIDDFTKALKSNPEIRDVQSITSWNKDYTKNDYFAFYSSTYSLNLLLQNNQNPLINGSTGNDLTLINVYPKNILNVDDTHKIINFINSYTAKNKQYKVLLGGVGARERDFTIELYRYVPQMLLLIFVGIYIILFMYMKSVFLPVKAGIMNFLPILSSFGILTLVFQYKFFAGFLHISENSGVINMVPIILFCVIFGLSMDYEVLILSRITEAYENTGDVKEAVIEGVSKSGSIITGAALILMAVFIPGIFSSSPPTKQISIGIASSILIDATIVRLLLVPSFMMLMGKWNWWNPFNKK